MLEVRKGVDSGNTDGNHNTCDTTDEDPRPAKRRKPRSAPAVTAPLHLRQSRPRMLHSTNVEIDDAQSQADCGYRSTLVDDEHHYTPRTSRSPPAFVKSAPVAEYQEWPFQVSSNHLHLLVLSEALGMRSDKEAFA
ncbi:hypothetical protein DL98DRAFT_589462 [Cadophora sp. DSE1049]|nr:hypothetical protein DL98DRAFT_589462 [Cadophora sp. DSE1049]